VTIENVDIYSKENVSNYTYRITISNYTRTMTTKEVTDLLDTVAEQLHTSHGANRM
jgi:phenylalanyl-tRNA synthetase beta subunit